MAMKNAGFEAAASAMIEKGLGIGKEKALKLFFELMQEYGWEYNLIFQRFVERVNEKINYKILAAGIIAYRYAQKKYIKPYDKVIPTLKELKSNGIKIGIVSDAPRLKAWMRLTELKLEDMFDVVVAYGDVRERKPSNMPFKKALKELGLNAEDVLMVGDMPEKDIKGAKAMGIKTCFAKYGCTLKNIQVNADYEIKDISELIDIIKK